MNTVIEREIFNLAHDRSVPVPDAAPQSEAQHEILSERWIVQCLTCSGTDHLSERHREGAAFWHKFSPHPVLVGSAPIHQAAPAQALAELRETFPDDDCEIRFTAHSVSIEIWESSMGFPVRRYAPDPEYAVATLDEAMAQWREWKDQQNG